MKDMAVNMNCHKEDNTMNKENILRKSREENRNGDEFVKSKEAEALNKSYLVSHFGMLLFIAACSFGNISGNVVMNQMSFELEKVLFCIFFLSLFIRNISVYVYLKRKKNLMYALLFLFVFLGYLLSILRLF